MAKKKKATPPPPEAGILMTANKRQGKRQLMRKHKVTLTLLEVLSLASAANYAACRGIDDSDNWLRSAFNALLDQCNLACEYSDRGQMTLIVPPEKKT